MTRSWGRAMSGVGRESCATSWSRYELGVRRSLATEIIVVAIGILDMDLGHHGSLVDGKQIKLFDTGGFAFRLSSYSIKTIHT